MATNTIWATSLLDEAAAIVEAEWIRLQQDEALWEREFADTSDLPAPRPCPPCVVVATATYRRPGPPTPADPRGCPIRRVPATPIWATQRSPPAPRLTRKALLDKGGDATTDGNHRQRPMCRPQ